MIAFLRLAVFGFIGLSVAYLLLVGLFPLGPA